MSNTYKSVEEYLEETKAYVVAQTDKIADLYSKYEFETVNLKLYRLVADLNENIEEYEKHFNSLDEEEKENFTDVWDYLNKEFYSFCDSHYQVFEDEMLTDNIRVESIGSTSQHYYYHEDSELTELFVARNKEDIDQEDFIAEFLDTYVGADTSTFFALQNGEVETELHLMKYLETGDTQECMRELEDTHSTASEVDGGIEDLQHDLEEVESVYRVIRHFLENQINIFRESLEMPTKEKEVEGN